MPPKRVHVICGPEPPKAKGPRVLASTNKDCVTYFNDVSSLKAVELKKLCRSHGNDEKKAKYIFLCHGLGLSTTGHAITESKVLIDHLSLAQIEVLHVPDVDILDYEF